MPERLSDSDLDRILALQFTVAWAGEAAGEPQRLGWWKTDLIDPEGGGLFARLTRGCAPIRCGARATGHALPLALRGARRVNARAPEPPASTAPREVATVHTRLLRTTLVPDDAYAYWKHVDRAVPAAERADLAFAERWFGTKSEACTRLLVTVLSERFDPFPEALALLQCAPTVPAALRPWICRSIPELDRLLEELRDRILHELEAKHRVRLK